MLYNDILKFIEHYLYEQLTALLNISDKDFLNCIATHFARYSHACEILKVCFDHLVGIVGVIRKNAEQMQERNYVVSKLGSSLIIVLTELRDKIVAIWLFTQAKVSLIC